MRIGMVARLAGLAAAIGIVLSHVACSDVVVTSGIFGTPPPSPTPTATASPTPPPGFPTGAPCGDNLQCASHGCVGGFCL